MLSAFFYDFHRLFSLFRPCYKLSCKAGSVVSSAVVVSSVMVVSSAIVVSSALAVSSGIVVSSGFSGLAVWV